MSEQGDATHTPGPWAWFGDELHSVEAYRRSEALTAAERWGEDGIHPEPIVETDSGYYGPRGADRDLIAASPDVLAALEITRGQWIHSVHAAQCLAAISKARG